MSTTVWLGNDNPQMQVDGQSVAAPHLNQAVTTSHMWDGFDDQDFVDLTLSTNNDRVLIMIARNLSPENRKYAVGVNELEQAMFVHSAGEPPAWVRSDDPGFAAALAEHFGCPVGEPTNLLTTGGRDALHSQHMNTAAQPASFNYIALANNATATTPLVGDTTLTGEITTGGGGLIRAQATYTHTGGTNTTTLTKTFTANGSDSLPVTVSQIGVFNASSSGTMAYKTALNATATLTISGDSVAITETVTLG